MFVARCISRPHLRHLPRTLPRHFSTATSTPRAARIASFTLAGVLGGSAFLYSQNTVHAEAPEQTTNAPQLTPLPALIRSYVVYTMCSIPTLVDWSPTILSTLFSVPGISSLTEALVRVTFFSQFVGGDTAREAVPLLEQLRSENKGALFAYSVEVDEDAASGKAPVTVAQPPHKRIVDEMITSIDVAADFEDRRMKDQVSASGRRTWVALKLTAMLPNAQTLINFSSYLTKTRPPTDVPFPGCAHSDDLAVLAGPPSSAALSTDDVEALKELHRDLVSICTRAKERGVRIIVDAEYSWYQPAIDAFTLALMREFNALPAPTPALSRFANMTDNLTKLMEVQPLVYATYQAYLKRTPRHLEQSLAHARAEGYTLGVKLVRGAYHPHEEAVYSSPSPPSSAPPPTGSGSGSGAGSGAGALTGLAIAPDGRSPVWPEKRATDACYDACAALLVRRLAADMRAPADAAPALGILFGTHNWTSCDRVLEALVEEGLARKEVLPGDGQEVVCIPEAVAERVTIGQLYGMSDALTNSLVNRTRSSAPFVIKYVPYGALSEVMPYLSRRAVENKSVLGGGGAVEERRRAGLEIRRRLFG